MTRQFGAVAAICSLAALHQAVAQPTTAPVPESGASVVMTCQGCGVINAIREIQQARPVAPSNPVASANLGSESPVGLVLYIPLGRGASETGAYAGAVGSREWQQRTTSTRYEFTVRMDNGEYRTTQKDGVSDLRVGDRVRLSRGEIERWGR